MKQRDSSLSHWKKWMGKRYAILDALILITGFGLIVLWSQRSFPSLLSASLWGTLLFLYFVFYRRLALIVYWSYWVGTAPPMAGLLRLVCAIPPSEPDVRLSPHPALHQMG